MSDTIRPDMTMEEVLGVFPSAQRALFQRYHVGGCSACGFQSTDTLAQVCKEHNLLDVGEVIEHLRRSDEVDRRMRVEPEELARWCQDGEELVLLDVRLPGPERTGGIPGAEELDRSNPARYMELSKSTRIVFVCQDGSSSIDVAAYFAGHGFTRAYALRGGVSAWEAGTAVSES